MEGITAFCNSLFNSMSYLSGDFLVDCGDWHNEYANVATVLLTHAHFDHIYGLNTLLKKCPNVLIYTNEAGKAMLCDAKRNMSVYHGCAFTIDKPDNVMALQDHDIVGLSGHKAQVVFTPGHSPSCISWIIGDAIFTGDAYIPGLKVVTNLPGGDKALAGSSVELIRSLAEDRVIYPGHPSEEKS